MYKTLRIGAVIPARDEAQAISQVVTGLRELRSTDDMPIFDQIIVCDNGSTDQTAELAESAGAKMVFEPEAGYGRACLRAIAELERCDVIVFVDGDRSIYPAQAVALLDSIAIGNDLVIGSRTLGHIQPGALTLPQRFGNRLAVFLIRLLWGFAYTDLGPFRAIRYEAYRRLQMCDETYGWTVEMQIKAVHRGLRIAEQPVDSLMRLGKSKISGTIKGVIGAGTGILGMVARLWWSERKTPRVKATPIIFERS